MPTGYTAGILDGTTNDFKTFAIHCSRAFLVHLRDEPMDSKYKERTPTDYHTDAISEAELKLKESDTLTDEEIILQEKNKLIKSKKYHIKSKDEGDAGKIKLESFLAKAMFYNPPTKEHQGICDFMQEQLKTTVDFDCNDYHDKELLKIDKKLNNLDAENIRSNIKIEATKDIAYHTKEHEEDLKRCRDTNKWYNEFIKSIDE